ncbi:MAG: FkbM family methyltransferase [bacterium]|nr:FkbM family methyltransferase [bacterium]
MKLLRATLGNALVLNYDERDVIIGKHVADTGRFEPYEEELFLSLLRPGDLAIDIGANIGIYTLQAALKIGPTGTVYAFEPEPRNYDILCRNIQENHLTNVVTFPTALSDTAGTAHMYLSAENYGDHRVYDAGYDEARNTVTIRTDTLDAILLDRAHERRHVRAIKSDTQGYEPFVVRGAERLIIRDQPTILLEYWPFGYGKAHADGARMLDFLLAHYAHAYVIEGGALQPLDPATLDTFQRKPGEAEGHRNLVFSTLFRRKPRASPFASGLRRDRSARG